MCPTGAGIVCEKTCAGRLVCRPWAVPTMSFRSGALCRGIKSFFRIGNVGICGCLKMEAV